MSEEETTSESSSGYEVELDPTTALLDWKCTQAAYHDLTYFTGCFQMQLSLPMRLETPLINLSMTQ